jgi:hypothetical protein
MYLKKLKVSDLERTVSKFKYGISGIIGPKDGANII